MGYVTLIYLAQLTRRIPIMPPFSPSHAGGEAGIIPFAAFFDVEGLSRTLAMPILEWKDIKNFTNPDPSPDKKYDLEYYGGDMEDLGCWSLWLTASHGAWNARGGDIPTAVGLDVSWMPAPIDGLFPNTLTYSLHRLAEFGFPAGRKTALDSMSNATWAAEISRTRQAAKEEDLKIMALPEYVPVGNFQGRRLEPDDHMLCFDYLYFTAVSTASALVILRKRWES